MQGKVGEKADTILYLARKRHIHGVDELGLKLHLSHTTTSRKINDPDRLTFAEAKKLSQLLGITLEELANI
jgi:hypothetical protein